MVAAAGYCAARRERGGQRRQKNGAAGRPLAQQALRDDAAQAHQSDGFKLRLPDRIISLALAHLIALVE